MQYQTVTRRCQVVVGKFFARTNSKRTKCIITERAWSREDFSRQANPAAFTGVYSRSLYNAFRQTVVDAGTENSAGGKCAYTMVDPKDYGKVKWLMSSLDGVLRYKHHVPTGFTHYYEHPNYFAVSAAIPEEYTALLDCIQPVLTEISGMKSDREKVERLNDYLCSRLDYRKSTTASIPQIFSASNAGRLTGACSTYSIAFNFLCTAAGIPCITIQSTNHAWNLVYAGGRWLHVDAAANDAAGQNYILLTETHPNSVDRDPYATRFLQEVLIPGSTK